MKKIKLFCITNKPAFNLEQLNLDLVGVGKNRFSNKYTECILGKTFNIKSNIILNLHFIIGFGKINCVITIMMIGWDFVKKEDFGLKKKKKI